MPLLALLALLAAPSQPPIAPLVDGYPTAKGDAAVSFQLGTFPTIGLSYFTSNNVAVRIDLGLNATLSPSGTPAGFLVGLGLRFYNWKHDRVAIFVQPSITFRRIPVPTNNPTEALAFGGGVGVEYFFTDHLSAGGILGAALELGNLGSNVPNSSTVTTLTTETSGLFLNVYF